MVKAKILITGLILTSQLMVAQSFQTVEEVDSACSQLGFMSDSEAEQAVDNILGQIGLFRNFVIAECPNINNAIAKNIDIGSGEKARYILYDSSFFSRITQSASNDWAAISILAHEIGHHLNGHALNNEGSNHKWELESDEFSGFVLARMGASKQDAQSALSTLKYEKASRTHPAKADRLAAAAKGWDRGSGNVTDVNHDVNMVNAQAVLTAYIDAIGGQEKVANIKTLKTVMESGPDTPPAAAYKLVTESLSPVISKTRIELAMSTNESLSIGSDLYTVTRDGGYLKSAIVAQANREKLHYIPEYQYLTGNYNFKELLEEEIDGQLYYVLKLPEVHNIIESDQVKVEMDNEPYNYYSANTGLLDFSINKFFTKTDYVTENEYLKDSEENSVTKTIYSDYKPADGVLFDRNLETIMYDDKQNETSRSTMVFSIIEVNPALNPEDFKVDTSKKVSSSIENSGNLLADI